VDPRRYRLSKPQNHNTEGSQADLLLNRAWAKWQLLKMKRFSSEPTPELAQAEKQNRRDASYGPTASRFVGLHRNGEMQPNRHRPTRVNVVSWNPDVAVSQALCESEDHQSYASTLLYAEIEYLVR
jgi:hypothetical protein